MGHPGKAHLVRNEALHLAAAKELKISVSDALLVQDRNGTPGLLVTRFDRSPSEDGWLRLPLEDGAQVLGRPLNRVPRELRLRRQELSG